MIRPCDSLSVLKIISWLRNRGKRLLRRNIIALIWEILEKMTNKVNGEEAENTNINNSDGRKILKNKDIGINMGKNHKYNSYLNDYIKQMNKMLRWRMKKLA